MTGPKKLRPSGNAGNAQPPACELTADEMALAVRYFSAIRRVEQKMADEANRMFVLAAENLAEQYPRHVRPALRLVGRGAK